MTKPSKLGVWTGAATLIGTLGLLPSLPATAAEDIEEVVVTGSYIKRDSFDSSSPITIVDQAAIAENATPNLGEVMVNQTFNYGTDFQTNTYAARSQGGNLSVANLRGLGTRATLDLVDGRRSIASNLNNAVPQIAIERIDILKDGASAIYGTDAVAGVVNLITRKNFSGTKFSAFYQEDSEGDMHEQQYEFLAGSDTDDGHFTMALGYKARTTLEQTERPEFLREGFERSGTGNPGQWSVPVRDANGAITGMETLADPGCGAAIDVSPGGTDIGSKFNFLTGDRRDIIEFTLGLPAGVRGGQDCAFHFGETWNYINPQEQFSFWGNYQFQFTENLSNEVELIGARLITDSRGSPQNPGGRTEEFPIVLGDHPGNPFRAYSDLDGDGAIDPGEALYAQDILDVNGNPVPGGDGIPDRSTTVDANGDGVLDVIVSSTPFVPGGASNGIPFNEDVDVVALRIFSKIGLVPGANQPSSLNADGSNTGNWTYDTINYRLVDALTYTVPDSSWEVTGTVVWERIQTILENKNTSQSALEQGLRGTLKATPIDNNYSYWNPFSTQALNCVNRVCTHSGTPDFANTVDVLDAVNIQSHNVTNTSFWSANVLATGDVYELPSGMILGAFGIEYRKNNIDADIDSARNQCDWHEGGCQFDYVADQDVYSGYFELSVPVIENMEAQIAGRYTDYGGAVGDSFDPKVAILWQPMDILSVRASYSTAFIAPNLEQLFEPEDCGLQTFNDDLVQDFSGTFRVACASGNPNLKPEEADVWNIGVSFSILDGDLNFGFDYAEYDFQDRISLTTGNQVVRADFNRFKAAGGDELGPDSDGDGISDDAEAWINGPNSDPGIQRDASGLITRVATSRINAQEMLHRAFDAYARYNLSMDRVGLTGWGDLVFNLNMTQAIEYSYDLGTGDPLDSGDGVGFQNEQLIEVPPLPEFRLTGRVNWFMGNHAAMVRFRWMDEVELEFNSTGLQTLHGLRNPGYTTLDDITYVDINYKYTFPSLLGQRETTVEVGANNVTDEFPRPFFNLGGIETYLHDVRGRMWYLRVNQDL